MKYSLTLRSRRTLSRSEARACLAANLAMPGAGSLAAGRAVGYWQLATAFGGFIITLLTGIPMIRWCLSNWGRLSDPLTGPDLVFDLWRHALWPLLGIGIYAIGFLWSVATGLQLLAQAPRDGVPPRIEPGQ
jgi:hypothetical protein